MPKVLVLCTGNSCRSIMAEALINHHHSPQWTAYSAGTHPSAVNPRAAQVLAEVGIDVSQYRSKSVTEFLERDDLDLVITVCDGAKQVCPVFLKPVKQIHIGIADPVDHTNDPDEQALAIFRATRDAIMEQIVQPLNTLI